MKKLKLNTFKWVQRDPLGRNLCPECDRAFSPGTISVEVPGEEGRTRLVSCNWCGLLVYDPVL